MKGFRNYIEVRAWLEGFIPLVYGKEELGLKRIEYLLKLLGNPERKFKSTHVAGTSGKGSTAYYIAKLLEKSITSSQGTTSTTGLNLKARDTRDTLNSRDTLKIGLHISPHLVDIRERMQILRSGKWKVESEKSESSLMSLGRFIKLFNEIKPVVEGIQKDESELTPSYFEILVAASFKYFAEEKVDWAVVEAGLGGRLDATNVLMPEVSVITNIGLDHTEILGDTVEKIAYEKAGIIKRRVPRVVRVPRVSRDKGVPVVTGATGSALRVIEKIAKEKGARVVLVSGSKYLVSGKEKKQKNPQNLNLAIAEKAVEIALKSRGKDFRLIRWFLAKQGASLLNSQLPGRFEEIEPGVILDGAHNPDKIKALIRWIKATIDNLQLTTDKKKRIQRSNVKGQLSIVLVLAFKTGKDWQKMLDLLIRKLPVDAIIATKYQAVTDTGKGSAVDPEEIAKYVSGSRYLVSSIRIIKNSQEATFEAIQATSNQQPVTILITGSLYLVGEVRTMWELPSFA